MTSFAAKVISIVGGIPRGKVLTYAEVARRAGNPRAARAVGRILHTYDSKKFKIPCHRVIRSDGKVGGYRWGRKKKMALLKKEGCRLPRRLF